MVFKIFVGIIILPFVFWGMGDVFRGGSQNVIAKIDSEKISAQEFVNYLRLLNLNEDQRKSLSETDLLNRVLSDYIGKKVLRLELNNLNVVISDNSLREIIKNDKTFFKNDKFSRTEYEKFLISSNLTAPTFEKNISEQEKRRQLLSFLSGGIKIPNFLIQLEYNKENQKKIIEYIDLKKYYEKPISDDVLKIAYDENKSSFLEIFKEIKFSEVEPVKLTGKKEYGKAYFEKINEIENKTLDNYSFEQILEEYNLTFKNTGLLNDKMKNTDGVKKSEISQELFNNFFKFNTTKKVELVTFNEKFYLLEINKKFERNKKFNNQDVKKALTDQIRIQNKIKGNTEIAKKITSNKFKYNEMVSFAKENGLLIKSMTIEDTKDNKVFSPSIIRRIFETSNKEVNIITDNLLRENFIILTKDTIYKKLSTKDPKYEEYMLKTRLQLSNNIYNSYDTSLNRKYNVEINQKTLNRIKESF